MSVHENDEHLIELSQIVVNGQLIHKLDHIASITINNKFYFNVFRRFNSVYNIVIEDENNDTYLHKNCTARFSLKNILCLSDELASKMYTETTFSFKHAGPAPSLNMDILDMGWSDIHNKYNYLMINICGIFENITDKNEIDNENVNVEVEEPKEGQQEQHEPQNQ